ncbi:MULTISPECIES: LysR family transcriptional regulator [unclassified Streptomyces]|uniref:LysR family transcriptional regulator n=1 Tax=unclassified Streptomyces TaxID=2593676 RepID=UPI000C26F167|nr:LysR substrate-binding domain-containing protein [Streptomyces sp. CB02959]PJN38254.1 LysR family transcriptional regulator [Streptomyces sp. CB02959]
MELRQLLYFVAVAEEANFTRAAARLHLAQPGVSAQVRQLERELGQPLLDRSGRSVTLTEVGAAVLPYARAALAAVEGARQTVAEFTGLLRGQVTLGLVSGADAVWESEAVSLLADFHDAHPQVDIAVTADGSERMLAALQCGELDLALLGTADEEPPAGLAFQIVVDEPLVAVVAPDNPLLAAAEDGRVPLAALRDVPLICLPRGTGIRGVLERVCADAGFRPRIAFEAAAPKLLTGLAARGLGVAVVPAPDAAGAGGLRTLEFREVRPRGRIALAWRAGGPAGPAARELLEHLRKALGTAGRPGDRTAAKT